MLPVGLNTLQACSHQPVVFLVLTADRGEHAGWRAQACAPNNPSKAGEGQRVRPSGGCSGGCWGVCPPLVPGAGAGWCPPPFVTFG